VSATDAQVLANFLVGISTSVPCPQNADVNGDGQVNVADVLLILQLSKGLRTSFSYQSTSVLAVTPSSGTANILLGAEISAIFSNPVSSASLPGNFTVADAVSGQISTGTFRCSQNGTISVFTPGVPFLPAHNYVVTLSTGITDNFGNPISTSVVVDFQTQPLGTMSLTSVNNSTATMNTLLSNPISVQLLTSTGAPAVQIPVVFAAQMGNGTFQPSGLRQVTILTDNNGNAALAYKTGTQAIVNTVSISAIGFSTVPVFQVATTPTPAVNLRLFTGGNQTGGVGSVAPLPLVVQATDAGGDYIQGTTVTFTVASGAGSFGSQTSSSVVTNSTGTAAVMFTFGASSGTANVSASFAGMVGLPPVFNLHGILPQLTTSTYISGNVIDSKTLLPLTSVYVYLTDTPSVWERTDLNGNFILPASTGPHVVEVDGFESGLIGGQMYPTVSYPVNAVQGMTTGLGIPAMLPELDQQSYLDVSNVLGGTLTIRGYPLWQVYVAPGQVTFQNGSHTGRLYASFVPHTQIPMPVAGGKSSRFDDTIQPPTVVFNPPAQTSFPNMDALPPGTMTDLFTLDYVSGAFKQTGVGVVSADGTIVTSLPGQGITQGGWHSAPPPNPPPPGCIGGNYYFGSSCGQASLSDFGSAAACTPVGGYPGWFYCLLCGLPSNQQGQPIASCTCSGQACPPSINPPPPSQPNPPPPSCPPGSTCPPQPNQCDPTPPTVTQVIANLSQPIIADGQLADLQVTVQTDPPNACTINLQGSVSADTPNVVDISGQGGATSAADNFPTDGTTSDVSLVGGDGIAMLTASVGGQISQPQQIVVVKLTTPSPPTISYGGADYGVLCVTPKGYTSYINYTVSPTGALNIQNGPIGNNPSQCATNQDEVDFTSQLTAPCQSQVTISATLGGTATGTSLGNFNVTVLTPTSTQSKLVCIYHNSNYKYGFNSTWDVTLQSSGGNANFNGLQPVKEQLATNWIISNLLTACPLISAPTPYQKWIIGPGGESGLYLPGVPYSAPAPPYPNNGLGDNDGLFVTPSALANLSNCSYPIVQQFAVGNCTTQPLTINQRFSSNSFSVWRTDDPNSTIATQTTPICPGAY